MKSIKTTKSMARVSPAGNGHATEQALSIHQRHHNQDARATTVKGSATELSYITCCDVCGIPDRVFKDTCFRCHFRFHEDTCGASLADRPGHTSHYCQPCYLTVAPLPSTQESTTAITTASPMTRVSPAGDGYATEQALSIHQRHHNQDVRATIVKRRFVLPSSVTERSLDVQARGFQHEHQNAKAIYENNLLLYFARSRPVARVHMATIPDRRACKGLRATWTLHCMSQLGRFDLRGCRGCGHYPTTTTCSKCATAWCLSCRLWSSLCWKCYRPRYSLTDFGEFVPGVGGPGGNGSFETPL
jgi:hypothetical protein